MRVSIAVRFNLFFSFAERLPRLLCSSVSANSSDVSSFFIFSTRLSRERLSRFSCFFHFLRLSNHLTGKIPIFKLVSALPANLTRSDQTFGVKISFKIVYLSLLLLFVQLHVSSYVIRLIGFSTSPDIRICIKLVKVKNLQKF